jgi:hypothetical protein
VASASNFLLLFIRLRGRIGLLGGRRLLLAAARVGVACVPMATWGLLSQGWWDVLAVPRVVPKAALLLGEMAVAAALFAGTAAALRCEEVGWALAAIRGRGKRTAGSTPNF